MAGSNIRTSSVIRSGASLTTVIYAVLKERQLISVDLNTEIGSEWSTSMSRIKSEELMVLYGIR